MWRISAHSIGTKASSIHLSLVALRWSHPTGRGWFFSHSIATKSSLVIWSVFLQDGVTLFGSGSNDLISSEGIPTVGLLGAFFRPVLRVSFCHPLVGRSALKRGGFHIQLSSLLARTLCVCPSSRRRSGSWPCCLSPSPGGSVCFGGLFYLWWWLPPRLVLLGGPLLGLPAVSSGLHAVGVVRRAIPSPGPLWQSLRIFCFGSVARGVSPFLHQGLSLAVVFSFHPVLKALLRSFRVSSPSRAVYPPSWALAVFLRHLSSSSFASLRSAPLRSLLEMVFFVALATAIPIGELQALSHCFLFIRGSACLSFVHTFVAKCELLLVPSLDPSWLYLCPALRVVSTYVLCFAQFVPSAFSWTGRLPCSVAPAVFLSLRSARLGLFLWPRFRSSSGWCSCGRCCQA